MTLAEELATLDATAQADLVRAGAVTPLELVDAAIQRIEAVDGAVNAVPMRMWERAREAAAGDVAGRVFGGVPVVVKDVAAAAGEPRYRGSRFLKDQAWVEDHDANSIVQLRKAGFINVGRSNLPELAGGITTEPSAHGPCRNPWDLAFSVGGSSGGSAAAVAAGMVPLAHGTDGGGSVRIPASINGVVGLKPTRGRVSQGPDFSDTEGFSVTSVLTRSVRDTAAAIDAIAGHFPGDPWYAPPLPRSLMAALTHDPGSLRIGIFQAGPDFPSIVHPDCTSACEAAGRLLESLGHRVEPGYPSAMDTGWPRELTALAVSIIGYEVEDMAEYTGRPVTEADVDPVIWQAYQFSKHVTGVAYEQCVAKVRAVNRRFDEWWDEGWDLLLTPTLAVPPYLLGATSAPAPDAPWPDIEPWVPFTPPFNATGAPAISVSAVAHLPHREPSRCGTPPAL